MSSPQAQTMELTRTASPKDFEDTKALFDRMGVKYNVTEKAERIMVSYERNEWNPKDQSLTKVNPKYVDYTTSLEIEQGSGHAAMMFYFFEGSFVHQSGYEV